MSWLAGYKYRKSFKVTHAAGELTNFQVPIRVAENDYAAPVALETAEHSGTGDPANASDVFTAVTCGGPGYWTGLTKANGFLIIDLKCSDPATMETNGQLEITSSGGPDSEEWARNNQSGLGITSDYQTFYLPLSDFSTTGGELDVRAINYIRWYEFTSSPGFTIYWRNAYISYYDISCEGHCESDFDDIRFALEDGTELDYWIETIEGTSPSQVAVIWVKIPTIAVAGSTYYMYYGNSGAPAGSDGAATMENWADFSAAGQMDYVPAAWSISGGELEADTNDGAFSATPDYDWLQFRAKIKRSSTSGICRIGYHDQSTGDFCFMFLDWTNNQVKLIKTGDVTGTAASQSLVGNTYYIFDFVKHEDDYYQYVDDFFKRQDIAFYAFPDKPDRSYLKCESATAYFDYFYVVKSAATNPVLSDIGSQEAAAGGSSNSMAAKLIAGKMI